jgi:nitrite reductase [NAD(P)H] small subunit
MNWKIICSLTDIPRLGARVVNIDGEVIAVFRTADDKVFALHDKCPHKGGPLSQGIVAGTSVTCPMHGWKIGLDSGEAQEPDVGRTPCLAVKLEHGEVWLSQKEQACVA